MTSTSRRDERLKELEARRAELIAEQALITKELQWIEEGIEIFGGDARQINLPLPGDFGAPPRREDARFGANATRKGAFVEKPDSLNARVLKYLQQERRPMEPVEIARGMHEHGLMPDIQKEKGHVHSSLRRLLAKGQVVRQDHLWLAR